ncbi:hypothetical protein QFZ32_000028 [Streptomyces canus]|nr:hypothetical protein [Streptomyces canus]
MHDAGLHDRPRPDRLHRLGQALEPVADQHQHIAHAAVLDLGEDVRPVLGALAAFTCPQPQNLPPALGGHGQGHVDGPVGHRTVADLHVDGIDENHRTDGVERPALPFGHALQHLVGDGGDGLPGDLGAIDLGQVRLHLPGGQALRGQRDDHLVDAAQALLPLLDDLWFEGAVAVAGHDYLHRSDISQDGLGAFAVAGIAAVLASRVVLVIAEVIGDLALQGGLQQPLGQLLEQPALTGQLQTLGLGSAHQLVDQLVVHSLCLHSLHGLDSLGSGHVLTGHRCTFHDRELHRTSYSPAPASAPCRSSSMRYRSWPRSCGRFCCSSGRLIARLDLRGIRDCCRCPGRCRTFPVARAWASPCHYQMPCCRAAARTT